MQMGDGETWRAVNESEIKSDEGSFRDRVSNGYGERQYEGGVRRNTVYVCCTVYSSMYLYGKDICVNVCECVGTQWSEA